MARGFGLGAGVGLMEGLQLGHGIKMDERASNRADRQLIQQEENSKFNREVLQERRGMEAEQQQWRRDDRGQQQEMLEAQKQNLRFVQAVYDKEGKLKDPSLWDTETLASVGNKLGMVKAYLANNPDVDQENPLLGIVPLKTKDGVKVTFRLNRTDGGAGVLTKRRSSDPDDPIVMLSPEELVGEIEDIFAGYGLPRQGLPVDPLAKERFKSTADQELETLRHKNDLELEGVKGNEARRTDAAKGIVEKDKEKDYDKELTDDVLVQLGDTQIDPVTQKAVTVLNPERTDRFLSFWKTQSGERDPRRAVTMFNDAERINNLSAAEIKRRLDNDPTNREYMVRLMSAEKRAELRKVLQDPAQVPQRGPALMNSRSKGIQ